MKRLALAAALILALTLSGCGSLRSEQLSREMMSESALVKEESGEIMRCLKESDREGFKALFCERARNEKDFDECVDRVFELIGEGFTSCDAIINTQAGAGKEWHDGEVVDWNLSPHINYITFCYDDGSGNVTKKYFEIRYFWQLAAGEYPDRQGIQDMRFMYLNVETVELGDYYD